VPNPPLARPDLQEARHRNHRARHTVTGLSRTTLWQQIELSLSDVPTLISEITHLSGEVRAVRLDRANLAAAARAALVASLDGEPDPLSYLRDELAAQGLLAGRDGSRDDRMRLHFEGRR
jgi:hypothetical protein